jgi:CDP-diacylglycerol--serine O-phosphatidyltransferase
VDELWISCGKANHFGRASSTALFQAESYILEFCFNEVSEMGKEQPMSEKAQSRGIYLLPNLFTTAALFAGFYSVVAAMKGYFDIAAIAVFIAMIADTLDGRVARMTHTQTAFGAEYDSLSDMVAFGVAPALIVYSWSLSHLGKLGWLIAFLYTAGTALRLARFNTQSNDTDKRYFQGLPCPPAAGVIAGCVWLGYTYNVHSILVTIPVSLLTVIVAALMVSTIRYHSFKQIDLRGKIPFIVLLIPVLVIVAIAVDPPQILFTIFFCYAFSGPLLTLWQLRKIRRRHKKEKINR